MFNDFLSALLIFFLIMNPMDLVPIFVSLTSGTPDSYKRVMAIKGPLIAWVILLFFGFFGKTILDGLDISIPAFRVGGGILLGITGVRMVLEHRQKTNKAKAEALNAHDELDDIAVFPLATLFLAGPGSMTAMIINMNESLGLAGQLITIAAVSVVLLTVMVSFLISSKISRFIPDDLTSAIVRVLGILLIALSVQLVFDGVKQAFGL